MVIVPDSATIFPLDYVHARRFATREARRHAGDLYPGPVLMPRGMLRALDPLIAIALGPARDGGEAFRVSFEKMLRGRPDGPLLLATWASLASGEVPHEPLRRMLRQMAVPPPERPKNRGEMLAWLHPRASTLARCTLAIAQRDEAETLPPAERLACGLVLVRLLCDLPQHLAANRHFLPCSDMEEAGLSEEELAAGVRTEAVNRFLAAECAWARALLEQGMPVCERVGDRLRRGLRAAILRAHLLLEQIEDPQRDLFRHPPRLTPPARWSCALRAWRPLA